MASFQIRRIRLPVCLPRLCDLSLRRSQTYVDAGGDRLGNLGLQCNDVFEIAIEALGPYMHLVAYSNQLRSDANPRSCLAHAAFEHVIHSKFLPNLVDAFAAVLVLHRRGAGDHSETIWVHSPKLGDHLLGHAIGEVLLAGIASEILEWQNNQPSLSYLPAASR